MGLFDNNDNNGNTTSTGCPIPNDFESLDVKGSSHHAMYLIAAICAIISLVSSVILITFHLSRYRAPKEQRQIIRILFLPFVFAVVSWAEISNYHIAPYIDPIGEVYESWCICAIFLLYIQYAAPKSTFNEEMFVAMANAAETQDKNANWPKVSWILVFQFPVTELIAVIVLEATQAAGTYCFESLKPEFGHLWTEIIRIVGVALAAMTVIRFYGRMKSLMKTRRGAIKLFGFKGFIGVHFIQQLVFSILISRNVIKTSTTFSYGDLLYGLPNVLLAIEATLLSALFWYAFSPAEYSSHSHPGKKYNFFHALADSLNFTDILFGVVRAFKLALFQGGLDRGQDGYYYEGVGNQYGPPGYASQDNGYGRDIGYGSYDQRGLPLAHKMNRMEEEGY